MRRSRKIILITLLAVVALAGSIGGVVYAQTGSDSQSDNQSATQYAALLDKVSTIYQQNTGTAINPQELQKAFDQARTQMRSDAMDKYLQSLVDQKKITQDQADQYKAWLNSKPDVPLAPGLPGGNMHRGFGRFGGGFHGWCQPQPTQPQPSQPSTQ